MTKHSSPNHPTIGIAIALSALLIAAPAAAQSDLLQADDPALWGKEIEVDNAAPNYLALCLANPRDRVNCYLAANRDRDGGLESFVRGQLEVATYELCDTPDGVCRSDTAEDGDAADEDGPSAIAAADITILFDFDSDTLRDGETAKVAQLARAFGHSATRGGRFAIVGHTDGKGDAAYNCALSKRRAASVAAALKAQGADIVRFSVHGAGEHILRDPDDSTAAVNRRVGFIPISEAGKPILERIAGLCS